MDNRWVLQELNVTHGIVSTLSIVAFGLLAARAGDLLRVRFLPKSACDDAQSNSSVWRFDGDAARSEKTWLNVQRDRMC